MKIIIIILFTLLVLYRFRVFIKTHFHKIFGIYVFTVFFLWSLPRVITLDQLSRFLISHNINILLDFYKIQYVPGDQFHKMLPVYFSLSLLVLYAFAPKIISFFNQKSIAVEINNLSQLSTRHICFTALTVLAVLLIKEKLNPFYFAQDDNLIQFLPRILFGLKMIFQGSIPFLDSYRYFGTPIFEEGVYAFFDPLMIFSFLISKQILGNIYITLDLYLILSLLIGTIFLGCSLAILRTNALVGIAAMLSYTLSGFFLITLRGWYFASGIACHLPILSFFFLRAFSGKIRWGWFISLGFFRSIYFYGGHLQFFVYGVLIEAICYLYAILKLKEGSKIFLNYVCSLLLTIGLAMPLLLSQYMWAKDLSTRPVEPAIAGSTIPFDALISSFLPYSFSQLPLLFTSLYHVGFIWIFCLFVCLVIYIRLGVGKFIPLMILAIVILLMSGGTVSLIYCLKQFIPTFNKFRFAFKLYPYASLLIIIYGSLILTYIKNLFLSRHLFFLHSMLTRLLILNILVVLIVAIYGTNTAYYVYAEKPYPPLDPQFESNLEKDDLIYIVTPFRYDQKPYLKFLPHDISSLFDLQTFNNYVTLYEERYPWLQQVADPIQYFKDIGITKIIVQKIDGSTNWEPATYKLRGLRVLYEDQEKIIYATNNPKWQIRQIKQENEYPHTKIEYIFFKYPKSKLKAKIISEEKTIWEYHREFRPGYYLRVNNKKSVMEPSSNYYWCMFKLPAGENEIEIDYMPPRFCFYVSLGVSLVILSCLMFGFLSRLNFMKRSY